MGGTAGAEAGGTAGAVAAGNAGAGAVGRPAGARVGGTAGAVAGGTAGAVAGGSTASHPNSSTRAVELNEAPGFTTSGRLCSCTPLRILSVSELGTNDFVQVEWGRPTG